MTASAAAPPGGLLRDFAQLAKLRIGAMVLLTAAVGFFLAGRPPYNPAAFVAVLLGTAFCAMGANALNQYVERRLDLRMQRTRNRPLPAGRLAPPEALGFGLVLAGAGLCLLLAGAHLVTAALAALCVSSYVLVYTPLKRKTWMCTMVGAVPGAIPTLMGASAVDPSIGAGGWSLFAILFLWQLPHFYAIAWLYRDDYARGGFPMLAVVDGDGSRTARQSIATMLLLVVASVLPYALGIARETYLAGVLALDLLLLFAVARFAARRTRRDARLVFLGSLSWLPAALILLLADRAPS